jgi:CRP-like cAMP-binding protein
MSAVHRRGRETSDGSAARATLAELEPDMLRFLTAEDREAIAHMTVPVVDVPKGSEAITGVLSQRRAFAAVVLDGMVLQSLQLGNQPGVHILGPGAVLGIRSAPRSAQLGVPVWRVAVPTRIALLGNDFLGAVRHSPQLLIGLHAALAEQAERLTTQLVICQLPRVEDRILAILWLLADTWGRVTAAGTVLPLGLTHELLGGLVGARRPTVTLALHGLAERGAVAHQDRGWLLLERPVSPPAGEGQELDEPRLMDQAPSIWAAETRPTEDPSEALAVLSETVGGLREQHARNVEQVRQRLGRSAVIRDRSAELRRRLRGR